VSEWDEDKDKDSNLLQNGDADPSKSKSKKSGKVVALEIPQGADPGLVHNNPSGFVSFSFNEVFDIDATQDDVFNKIQPMVMDVFEGINSTVLAYGQTGSGKTYSICGGNTYAERGLIPRSIALVFEELAVRRENSEAHIRYKVLVSFTEVFGENLYDLLDPQKRNLPLEEWQKVQVLEGEDGLILRNINVFEVASEEEVLNLFFMGTTNR
jgi:kinesin family protein 6/9